MAEKIRRISSRWNHVDPEYIKAYIENFPEINQNVLAERLFSNFKYTPNDHLKVDGCLKYLTKLDKTTAELIIKSGAAEEVGITLIILVVSRQTLNSQIF